MSLNQRSGARPRLVMQSLDVVQEVVYIIVGVLLAGAGVAIVVGTVEGVVESISSSEELVRIGLLILDRILLLLIVAELLHTLRIVLYEGEIFAEPFLLVGLIAVVRRVVVVTAQVEQTSGRPLTNLLLELGVLAALALAFGAAIFLLRRGTAHEPALEEGEEASAR